MNDNPRDDKPIVKDPHAINEQEAESPSLKDEEYTEGDYSDKDTLDRAHDVGLYTESDEDHPHPVNIAQEVEEAEKDIAGIEEAPDDMSSGGK